jgi:hypothetical protein
MAQLSMQTTCCMRSQIHIKNFADALDWTQVEQVLVSATKRFGMVDTTVTSRVPQTIFCCAQKVGHGFGIGGRVHGDLGIVDFYPGKQPSEHFLPIVKSLANVILFPSRPNLLSRSILCRSRKHPVNLPSNILEAPKGRASRWRGIRRRNERGCATPIR